MMLFLKQQSLIKSGFCDRWIKFSNIELNEDAVIFSSIFLNRSITEAEFLHWLTRNNSIKCWFIFSKIDLLILPNSLLERFIKL